MRQVCKLYRRLCRFIGPRKLTISAWLWIKEQEGSCHFWRAIVDDWFLIYRIEEDHCRKSYERETAQPGDRQPSGAMPNRGHR